MSNMNFGEWMTFGLMALGYLFIIVKAIEWAGFWAIKRGWRIWNRKNKKQLAMAAIYDAFELNKLRDGQVITATTKSGITVEIYRQEKP